jgi:hypothetical protein
MDKQSLLEEIGGGSWWEKLVGEVGWKSLWEKLLGKVGGESWWETMAVKVCDNFQRRSNQNLRFLKWSASPEDFGLMLSDALLAHHHQPASPPVLFQALFFVQRCHCSVAFSGLFAFLLARCTFFFKACAAKRSTSAAAFCFRVFF